MSVKPLFVLVGADKGGVGKTTVTRTLLDHLDAHSIPSRVFDTEHPEGDLRRFRDNTYIVDITRVQDQMVIFDNVTPDCVTVIDLRAGMLSEMLRNLDECGMLNDVRDGIANMAVLHVLGPSVASLNEVAAASKLIGNATHFLVRNDIDGAGLGELAEDPRYVELLARMQPLTINISKLKEPAGSLIQQKGVGFAAFTHDPANSRLLSGIVKSWLARVAVEFDRVGLTGLVKRSN